MDVHSCYGTDRGEMALTPGENTDLLYLRGSDARLTVDVSGTIVELRPLDRKENPVTQVVQNDAQGRELPSGGGFDYLTVVNPWPAEALSRVVAVALDAPGSGPQGAIEVVSLTPHPVVVPANSMVINGSLGSALVVPRPLPAEARTATPRADAPAQW